MLIKFLKLRYGTYFACANIYSTNLIIFYSNAYGEMMQYQFSSDNFVHNYGKNSIYASSLITFVYAFVHTHFSTTKNNKLILIVSTKIKLKTISADQYKKYWCSHKVYESLIQWQKLCEVILFYCKKNMRTSLFLVVV